MDRAHIGWLAGIIDGEGNFTIRILFRETKTLGRRARFQPQLVIANTRKTMIDRIAKIYDNIGITNRIYIKDRRKYNPRWKICYQIIIYATGLRTLIPLIKPYIDKQEEIVILEEFLRKNKRKGSGNIYTNEELQEMEKLRQSLVEIHGEQARKMSTRMANECLLSDEEVKAHKQKRLDICKKMKIVRLDNQKTKKGETNDQD